jgi:hypothetical protein
MRMKTACLVTALALSGGPLCAQQQAGDTELQLQGSLSLAASSRQNNSGAVDVKVGRFWRERQEIGLQVTGYLSADRKISGYGGPFYRYNFGNGHVVPYLGASAAASFGSFGTGKNGLLAAEGGVRFFLDRRTAFSLEGSTGYSLQDHQYSKQVQILFGFSHLWGS